MKKCEPWTVAAVYLMQSTGRKEHYTKIVNYILETELTELTEKGVATSHKITELLNQKVINGRAVFSNDGNGYYSLNNEDTLRKNEDIRDVIQSLESKNIKVNVLTHEGKQRKPLKEEDPVPESDDDTLGDEARKLSDETRRLSDEARKLSDETRKLSDETIKLSDENKKLREQIRQLQRENRQLSDENAEMHQEAGKLRDSNQQLKETLQSISQLCEQV